ncbi:MAG TPA: class I SAM-dependent methyltransferase [Bryobacteraceae bacterium]|nr:class I SAM-dependent methyltransferase [Bryobacteraceae bacterium]
MIPTFEEYLDRLGRHAGQPGTLIDIGAASGFFLSLARRRGWRVSGVEPSDFASSLARDKGLDVRTGTVENCHFAAGAFDVVTMWDVIEHIPDPRRAIASIVSLLKPGGLIAINTPDSTCLLARLLKTKWHLVVPPEHLNLFSRESLRLLLAKHGLEVLEAATIGKTFTVQYVLMTLAHWQRLHVFDAASEAVRGRRLGQWKISLNLRDNVFMIARKK